MVTSKDCATCPAHDDMKEEHEVLFSDLKKMVPFKVFSLVLIVVVAIFGGVMSVQYNQVSNVRTELLAAIHMSHSSTDVRMGKIEGSMSSLALNVSDITGQLKIMNRLLGRFEKQMDGNSGRILWLERKRNGSKTN